MTTNYYKSGTWNVYCDLCGKRCKSDEVLKRWDGLIVCKHDYETRQPLDFIRPTPPERAVPFTRPESADVFIEHICTIPGLSGIAGYAQAACSKPSNPLIGDNHF